MVAAKLRRVNVQVYELGIEWGKLAQYSKTSFIIYEMMKTPWHLRNKFLIMCYNVIFVLQLLKVTVVSFPISELFSKQ